MTDYPNLTKVMMRPLLIAVVDFFIIMAIGSMMVF